jgi:hypothetical protein
MLQSLRGVIFRAGLTDLAMARRLVKTLVVEGYPNQTAAVILRGHWCQA